MSAASCIGEPVSWPRLEAHALARDPMIDAHVAACPACAACLEEIRRDVVALPGLPELAPRRARRWFGVWPALAAACAVAILILIVRPRGDAVRDRVSIKGVGEVIVDVVRERAGVVREDVRTFAAGDRWKVVVTCPPSANAVFGVEVRDGQHVDRPLAPAELACGNRIVLPGAFTLDGAQPNDVCVRVNGPDGDAGFACVTVRPEPRQ